MAIPNNLLGGFGAGFNAGNAMTQNMIDTRKQNEFARLASQSYSAAPDQQQGLLGQMAAIDPAGAQAQQGQFQQQDDRRKAQLVNASRYLDRAFKSGDQAAIQGAYRAVKPAFQQLDPSRPLPDEADDSMLPMLHQILATADGGAMGANVQSTYVDGDGNRVAIMRDGTTQVLGANDAGATQQTITINGPDGRPAQYTFDRRTGNYIPAGASMGAAQVQPSGPQQFTGSDGAQVSIGADIPANVAAKIRAMESQGVVPDQIQAAPVSVPQQSYQGSPFVGRSPDEQAALTEAAKEQVQLGFLPQRGQIEAQNAGLKKSAEMGIDRTQKAAADLPRITQNASEMIGVIDKLLTHPGKKMATGLSSKIDPRNFVPGQPGYDFGVAMDQIKGKVFLQAFETLKGGGQITEVEGEKATAAIARLNTAQSEGEFDAALSELREIVVKAVRRAERAAGGQPAAEQSTGGPQPGTVEDGYRFRGGDPADPNSWERT